MLLELLVAPTFAVAFAAITVAVAAITIATSAVAVVAVAVPASTIAVVTLGFAASALPRTYPRMADSSFSTPKMSPRPLLSPTPSSRSEASVRSWALGLSARMGDDAHSNGAHSNEAGSPFDLQFSRLFTRFGCAFCSALSEDRGNQSIVADAGERFAPPASRKT